MTYLITAACFPNGEVRLAVTPQKKAPPDRESGGAFESHESQVETTEIGAAQGGEKNSPLSYSQNSKLFPPGFGSLPRIRPFSLYGRRMMRRAGGAWDDSVPPSEVGFFTGTLPGSTQAAMRAIAEWSGYIVHRVKAWAAKYSPQKEDMYCWEWQKRGALHLHYCCRIPSPEKRASAIARFHRQWRKLLLKVSELSGVDLFERPGGETWKDDERFPRTDAQECLSSAAGYLAKYTSKGSGQGFQGFCPSQWYGISRPLLSRLRGLSSSCRKEFVSHRAIAHIYEELFHCVATKAEWYAEWRDDAIPRGGLVAFNRDKEERSELWQLLESIMSQHSNSRKTFSSEKERHSQVATSIPTKDELEKLVRLLGTYGTRPSQPLSERLQSLQGEKSLSRWLGTLSNSDWLELKSLMSLMPQWSKDLKAIRRVNEYVNSRVGSLSDMRQRDNPIGGDGPGGASPPSSSGGAEVGCVVDGDKAGMRLQLSLFGSEVTGDRDRG